MYYLKYRPKKFNELEGLADVAELLKNAVKKKPFPHAYIFTGPKGSGKTTTARILAKALNCLNLGKDGEPCNQCSSCQAVNEGRFLDLIEIDAASNRGIDDVRELREKIKLSPAVGNYKIYIIDEVHMLTNEAFNAMLKTLEEPPAHAVFVLATTEFNKIPETIKSRCLVIKFRRGKKEDVIAKLELIVKKEGAKVSKEDLSRIAQLSEGGFRNAETLLEQVVAGGLSLSQFDFAPGRFLDFVLDLQQKEALEMLDHLASEGESLSAFGQVLIYHLRSLLLILGGVGDDVLDVGEDALKALKLQAEKIGRKNIIFFLNRLLEASEQEKYSPIPQLPLELAVFDLVSYVKETSSGKKAAGKPKGSEDTDSGPDWEDEEPGSKGEPQASANDASSGKGGRKLTLAEVIKRWEEVLRAIKPYNHSLEALLRSCRPREVSPEGTLLVEVFYRFHKDRLATPVNADILKNVLNTVFGCAAEVNFVLTERAHVPAAKVSGAEASGSEDIVSAALEAFSA